MPLVCLLDLILKRQGMTKQSDVPGNYSQEIVDEPLKEKKSKSVIRSLGLGLITGAADDDPSAVGTYASAGAKFGPAFLWVAL